MSKIVPHKKVPPAQRHAIHSWEVANSSERDALAVTVEDLYKVAFQVDTHTYYTLVNITPILWKPLVGSATEWLNNDW